MADLFQVAPGGLAAIKPRSGSWVWIHGVADVGASMQFEAGPVWTVNHNLGRIPTSVQVRTMGGVVVEADVRHVNDYQLQVLFDVPTAGIIDIV